MRKAKTTTTVVSLIAAALLALLITALLTGCSEADKIILEAEGYMSISNNGSSELVVTCKVGPNEYKKNYIYLNDYTLYVVEDISGTHTDPYHYKMYFHTEFPVDVEARP